MPNLNKVMLMGNLTRDPELRYTPNNTAVANLGMAINRRWFNKQTNENQEETTFVDLEAWGRTAEVLNQYLKKGRPLYVEGRLKLDQWQDKESGGNRSKLKIVVETFEFLDSRGEGGGSGGSGGGGYPQQSGRSGGGERPAQQTPANTGPGSAPGHAPGHAPGPTHQPVDEEDIPF